MSIFEIVFVVISLSVILMSLIYVMIDKTRRKKD